jgi:hypothetical protein
LVAGGSLASSTLTLESTSIAGTTDSIALKTGSQVTALQIDTNQCTNLKGIPSGTTFITGQVPNLFVNFSLGMAQWSNDIVAPDLRMGKSRATSPSGTAIVHNSDPLNSIRAGGDMGNGTWGVGTMIESFVDGVPSATSLPGRLVFKTQPVGTFSENDVANSLALYRDQSFEFFTYGVVDQTFAIGSNTAPTSTLTVRGAIASQAPRTLTNASETQSATDSSLIANRAGTVTITLLAAASYPGQWLYVKTIQAQTVVSNASNVVPKAGGGAGTAILAGTAGNWAALQSDGTNWVIMMGT